MRPMLALLLIAVSSTFLFIKYREIKAPLPKDLTPPVLKRVDPTPFLSLAEIKRIRRSAKDADPNVRWTAMELLFLLKDPESIKILQKTVADDPDPDIRIKAIKLLERKSDLMALAGLIKGILDVDISVRLASLKSIAEIGDPAATPWVLEALKDIEPDVRMEALRALGRFQDKRKAQYAELSDRLRKQYEAAVKKQKDTQELGLTPGQRKVL